MSELEKRAFGLPYTFSEVLALTPIHLHEWLFLTGRSLLLSSDELHKAR